MSLKYSYSRVATVRQWYCNKHNPKTNWVSHSSKRQFGKQLQPLVCLWATDNHVEMSESSDESFETRLHNTLINSNIIGKRWIHRYYSCRSLNEPHSAGMWPIPWSNPIITKVTAPGCIWSNTGFVPLKFHRLKPNPKELEMKRLMSEGEWNCSHIHSFRKGRHMARQSIQNGRVIQHVIPQLLSNEQNNWCQVNPEFKIKRLTQVVYSFLLTSILGWSQGVSSP